MKIKHSENCLEAHRGVGKSEGFTCTDNCFERNAAPEGKANKVSHTPTPWAWDDNGMLRSVETGDTIRIEATYKSTDEGPANAEFIVHAVNEYDSLKRKADSHEGLMAENAVKSAVISHLTKQNETLFKALRSARNEYRSYVLNDPHNLEDAKGSRILSQIDDAIAQAEGK